MGKKRNQEVCPVCKKRITSAFKLFSPNHKDKTVCERCARYCHFGCVVRVRDSYLHFCLEYSVCKKCYPEIEDEDQLRRRIGDGEGYEEYMEELSRKGEDDSDLNN